MKHNRMKKHIKKSVLLEAALILGLVISILISSAFKLETACDDIKSSVLRLHVIANSDSDYDQTLKLKVRDELLGMGTQLFSGAVNAANAEKTAAQEISTLEKAAKRVLEENGCDCDVHIEIDKSKFPTRTYDNITLPAGEYEAVKVVIGKGDGHNWWCVMFPPMCLPAAEGEATIDDVLTKDALKLVSSNPKYEIRFKLVEWYEWAKERLSHSR